MIQFLIAFFAALPELIKFINNSKRDIKKHNKDVKLQAEVKQNLQAVNKAFEDEDAKIVTDIFNS